MTKSKRKPIISPVFGIVSMPKEDDNFGVTKLKYQKSKLTIDSVDSENTTQKTTTNADQSTQEPVKEKDVYANGFEGALFDE